MNFKTAFFIALIFLLVSNVGWLATFIDQMITYDHTSQEYKYQRENLFLVKKLLLDFSKNITKEEILTILENTYSKHLIKAEDGLLFVDGVGLKFEENKLTEITYMNEP